MTEDSDRAPTAADPAPVRSFMVDDGPNAAARLRQLVAFTTDAIFELARDHTYRWVSPAVTELLGWEPAALVGTSGLDLIHPEDVDSVRDAREHPHHARTAAQSRFRMRTRDGAYRWVSGRSNEIWTAGRVTGWVESIRDAEPQVRAEAELRASRERYRLLAENSSDVVFEGDDTGVITWITDGVTPLLGWRPDEMVGMPLREFIHPDDAEALETAQRRVRLGESQTVELRVQTVPGDYLWVSSTMRPLLDDNGDPVGEVGSWRDVNAQRLAAEALARSEELFRTALDNSASGMCLVGADGAFLRVNAALCQMLGRPPEVLMACRWQEITHPDDLATDQSLVDQVLAGERDTYRMRKRYLRPDGTVVWGDLAVSCVRNPDGTLRNFISQITDITEAQQAKEATEAAERQYRLLAENASDVVFLADHDQLLTWVSPAVTQALGWTADELLGRPITNLMKPEYVAATMADRVEFYAHGRDVSPPGGYLMELRTKAGDYRWFAGRARPFLDPHGQPAGVVAGLKDVTDVVTARARAEAREARRKAMLDSFLDPHVLLAAVRDDTGRIVDFTYADVNQAACDYMRMTPQELLGTRVLDVLPGQAGSGMLALYAAAVESGEPLVLDDYGYAHEILGSDRRYDIRGVKVGDALSFTWRDVTERSETARRIAESEERYRLIAENSSDVVLRLRDDMILWASPSLRSLLGWEPEDWLDAPLTDFVHEEDLPRLAEALAQVATGEITYTRYRVRGRDGTWHWVDASAKSFIDESGQVDGVAASLSLADEVVRVEEELRRQARFDTLTGLLNRPEALSLLDAVVHDRRDPGPQTALLYCDLDDFKHINDSLGHTAGDDVLRALAERITAAVRQVDSVARIGGDELLVVLPGLHALEEAIAIAERVRQATRAPITTGEGRVVTTLSVGVTMLRPDEYPDDAIARADRAMYEAKAAGGDRICAG